MEGAEAELFCSNEDCDFDVSGKCVEGQADVSQCPFRKPSSSKEIGNLDIPCLLYTSPSPRDRQKSRMPSSA